jgi:hypothetical protein
MRAQSARHSGGSEGSRYSTSRATVEVHVSRGPDDAVNGEGAGADDGERRPMPAQHVRDVRQETQPESARRQGDWRRPIWRRRSMRRAASAAAIGGS